MASTDQGSPEVEDVSADPTSRVSPMRGQEARMKRNNQDRISLIKKKKVISVNAKI